MREKLETLAVSVWYGEGWLLLKILLLPLSMAYGLAGCLRSLLFEHGIRKTNRLPVPVISVGNITVGGTGKTPLVIYLAELLHGLGVKVAIVSRGYGGRRKGNEVNVVSSGNGPLLGPDMAGDEAFMMATRLPHIPVLVGANRFVLGEFAIKRLGVRAIILDDGFQHRQLHRDLNICVVDSERGWGNSLPLPCGPLREFPRAIERADCIVVSTTYASEAIPEKTSKLLGEIKKPVVVTRYTPTMLLQNGEAIALESLKGKRVLAFCGIGNPASFRQTLEQLGANCVSFKAFGDHHDFNSSDVALLEKELRETAAEAIITTEKDSVKVKDSPIFFASLLILRIALAPRGETSALEEAVTAIAAKAAQKG